jgi:hypothetical protein
MPFEVKKPNPIYSINTKTSKGPNVATEQIGDQNELLLKKVESKGLYKQTFIPTYSTKNKVSIDPKILELNAIYASYFKSDHTENSFNSFELKQDQEGTPLYIDERNFSTDQGALGRYTIGNI